MTSKPSGDASNTRISERTAKDVIIYWLEGPPVVDPRDSVRQFNAASADDLIAYLAANGFEIIKASSTRDKLAQSRPR